MLGFIIKAILVILVIGIAIEIMNSIATDISKMVYDTKKLINAGKETSFMPVIHYRRCMEADGEGESEYLRKICPSDSAAAKDRFRILYDFSYCGDNYFLLSRGYGNPYLRKYSTIEGSDEITRYVLENVKERMAYELKEEDGPLDRFCRKNLGKGIKQTYINHKDELGRGVLLNTYQVWYGPPAEPVATAYKMETTSVESVYAKVRSGGKSASACSDAGIDDYDPDFDDFDPDFDEVPDGYFVNEFGELEPGYDPNKDPKVVGSDAWNEEGQRLINDSLYVNHDWDIFKVEEKRCNADPCHNPYHHHKK